MESVLTVLRQPAFKLDSCLALHTLFHWNMDQWRPANQYGGTVWWELNPDSHGMMVDQFIYLFMLKSRVGHIYRSKKNSRIHYELLNFFQGR